MKPLILEHGCRNFSATFSPDSGLLDSGLLGGISTDQTGQNGPQPQTSVFWRTSNWQELNRVGFEAEGALALSPNGHDVAALAGHKAQILDVATGQVKQNLPSQAKPGRLRQPLPLV